VLSHGVGAYKGDVLYTANGRTQQVMVCPLGQGIKPVEIHLVVRLFVQVSKRRKNGHSVYILGVTAGRRTKSRWWTVG
jgi:hypothetical protein